MSPCLLLTVPPSIRDNSGDSPVVLNVLAGKSVTLECESNAVPPPTITWYKNGRVVTESANLRVLAEGQMLEIKGSEVRDKGMLCCLSSTSVSVSVTQYHYVISISSSAFRVSDKEDESCGCHVGHLSTSCLFFTSFVL